MGSVRAMYDDTLNEDYYTQYAPYGDPFGSVGSNPTPYGFTGEPTDISGLVNLRAGNQEFREWLNHPTNLIDPEGTFPCS